MLRHVLTLHRKPRTRRERMLVRLHTTREGISRRWARMHRKRRARNAQRRAQELFLHLERRLHSGTVEPAARAPRGRPHVPHVRHR